MTDAADADYVIGALVLMRHGDRMSYYQLPHSYIPSSTELTAAGENQSYILGSLIRSRYLVRSSKWYIPEINPARYTENQVMIKADAGGEGSAIFDSVVAASQGLFPANRNLTTTMADGAVISSPLNGYQYVGVTSVDPEFEIYLEGWTNCNTFVRASTELESTANWENMARDNADFLQSLEQYIGFRPKVFSNMWNIWDYMNVQYLHNATFRKMVPAEVMARVKSLANWHQWNTFSSDDPYNIRNIAGQAMAGEVLQAIGRLANPTDPMKLAIYGGSYKTFIGLFSLLGVTEKHPEFAEIVDYSSALALEVRQRPAQNAHDLTHFYVRFNFRNGTGDANFTEYPMLGREDGDWDVPLEEFLSSLGDYAISDTPTWCTVCNNTMDRGCDYITAAGLLNNRGGTGPGALTPLVAGVIGASVSFIVALMIIAALLLLGWVRWQGRTPERSASPHRRSGSVGQAMNAFVVRMSNKKRESGDSESTHGVVKEPGAFEMMDDFSVLSRQPSHAPSEWKEPLKV